MYKQPQSCLSPLRRTTGFVFR